MIVDLVLIACGLVALTIGADYLVRAVVTLAQRMNLSTLLVSLTVVALGTSLPELFVVIESLTENAPGIGMGNIVGSNIANLLLILGVAAVLRPLATNPAMLKRDGLAMLAGTFVFVAGASMGVIHWWIGAAFLALLIGYFGLCYMQDGKIDADEIEGCFECSNSKLGLILVAGLAALIIGSEFLVEGSVSLARDLGVSETAIGLTLVAVGTSLPELATTFAAVRRQQFDVVIGNVLGSNLFNILGVIGLASLFTPIAVPDAILQIDLWLMALATVVTLVLLRTGWTLDRREAVLMLTAYASYILFQFGVGPVGQVLAQP